MRKKKIKPPFEIMIIIVNYGEGDKVVELLKNNNIPLTLQMQGRGTAESDVADIFGFGVVERDVVACFVEEERSRALVEMVYTDLKLDMEHTGLVFTIQPSGATMDLIKTLKIEVWYGKN